MQLFSGFFGKRLAPLWEYTVKGVLWRLFPGGDGLLIGEDRDLEKKSVSFFALDEVTGSVRWKDVTFPEPWWISMDVLHGSYLILHEYAAPDMPDHKKIYAVDAASGRTLWSNDDAKFLFAHRDHLYAARETFEERIFSEHRLSDGALLRRVDPAEIRLLEQTRDAEFADPVIFPDIARPGEEAVPEIGAVIAPGSSEQTEYIAGRDHTVVAACTPSGAASIAERSYRQRIAVYDRSRRRVVFDDVMNARLSMPVPDMFFCKHDVLYYIREKRTLCAVHLGRDAAHENN